MGGMVYSRARRLVLRSSGRVRTYFTVSIAQPRTTFCVLQAASPLRRFLREIGSSRAMLSLLLGRKSSSMARKRCRVICLLYVAPPCVIPMKLSRYTSTWARAVAHTCGKGLPSHCRLLVLPRPLVLGFLAALCPPGFPCCAATWCGAWGGCQMLGP